MLNSLNRAFCFFCVLTLIAALIPQIQAVDENRYGYTLLENEKQMEAYGKIEDGIKNCDTEITFSIPGISQDDVVFALRMVIEDFPEYFWFDGNASLEMWSDGKVVLYPVEYSVNGKRVDKSSAAGYLKELEDAAQKALKDLPASNDLEKVHYLHDYVANAVEYEFGENDQTAYGALVQGKAVCAGYSRALQYLLFKAGIQSWYVTGYGLNPTTGETERHGWNLILLDGKCYYTDVTWDDQKKDIYHAYFMLPLEEMSNTHIADHPEYLPKNCGHTDKDYFVVHGGQNTGVGILKNGYTAADIAGFMKETSQGAWECHMEDLSGGNADTFVTWLNSNIKDIAKEIGITGSYTYSYAILWDEYQITIFGSADHQHAFPLLKVDAVEGNCTQGGHTSYYICNTCQQWFSDSAAQNSITDKSSVNTAPKGHNYSEWKFAGDEHWKACSVCNGEEYSTRAQHADNNRDNKCDSCSAKVQSNSQSVTTNAPENPTSKPTDGPSQESTSQPSTSYTEETTQQSTDTDITVNNPPQQPTENTDHTPDQTEHNGSAGSTETSVPATQGQQTPATDIPNTEKTQDKDEINAETPAVTIIIAGAAAVCFVGGVTFAVIRSRKRKH